MVYKKIEAMARHEDISRPRLLWRQRRALINGKGMLHYFRRVFIRLSPCYRVRPSDDLLLATDIPIALWTWNDGEAYGGNS